MRVIRKLNLFIMCVYVYVCEREKKRQRGKQRDRGKQRERQMLREGVKNENERES